VATPVEGPVVQADPYGREPGAPDAGERAGLVAQRHFDGVGALAGAVHRGSREDLEAALVANDGTGIQAGIEEVDRAMNRILSSRATLGAAANRIEKAIFRAQADDVSIRTALSETEDTDMARAIMELQIQETAYQAAQSALAKAIQPSLAQFLR
jgi:flagellin-like hook-associated protein FlgL